MKSRQLLIILFCIAFLLSASSCKKITENKIQGKWRLSNVSNSAADRFQEWEFTDGTFSIDSVYVNGSTIGKVSSGEYIIKVKSSKRILTIVSTTNQFVISVGDWRIDKLTKNNLSFFQDDNRQYKEFSKQ